MPKTLTVRRVVATSGLAVIAGYAVVWPLIAPPEWQHTDYEAARQGPMWPHLFGTDTVGADMTVNVARALQVSLTVAASSALIAALIGTLIGAAAAALGGKSDSLLMRFTDAVSGLPSLLATLIIVALFRGSEFAVIGALAATHWPAVARIVRSETLAVMSTDYVAATRAAGASTSQIVRHHVLSAVAPQAGVAIIALIPHAVWHESTLSFLGVGMPPETPSLGTLISAAGPGLLVGQWWQLLFPAAALVIVTIAVSTWLPSTRRAGVHTTRGDVPYTQTTKGAQGVMAAIEDVSITIPGTNESTSILANVSLQIPTGTVTALIGESGAGKTSTAHLLCGTTAPGTTVTGNVTVTGRVGYLPQHPAESFTPTRRIRSQIDELLDHHQTGETVDKLAERVGIPPALLDRYPHQLSGGQNQRAALIAALASSPNLLVADEPTSGLDPAAAAHVLALLRELADDDNLTLLIVSHDLRGLAASGAADTLAVIHQGQIVETGPAKTVLNAPASRYTQELVSTAIPATSAPASSPEGHVNSPQVVRAGH